MLKKNLICLVTVLFAAAWSTFAQGVPTVSGTVTDVNGPVVGAVVLVQGTDANAVTDLNGAYTISAGSNAVLEFTCLGYKTRTEAVAGRKVINVVLEEDTMLLQDAIVLGYGATARKKDLSASVGVLSNTEDLVIRPVSSTEAMLQGQLPGVTISATGGDPTSTPSIVIRGQGSRNGDSVLWVVDGVPGAPLTSMNDIESIVVLKDAASAAIYGAQSGAGGVILVTTKKAARGISVGYDGIFGVRQATNLPQSLNAEEEIEMRKQSYANAGLTLPAAWDTTRNPWIKTTRTNWMDEIFRSAFYQRHNVSLNYGNEDVKNRLSLSMDKDNGVLVGTYNNNVGIHYNGDYNINKWVKITEDLTWKQNDRRGTNTTSAYSGAILSAIYMPQSAEAYKADGSYGGTTTEDPAYAAQYGSNYADAHGDAINPLRILLADNVLDRTTNFWTTSGLEIANIVKGLKFISRFTYATDQNFYKRFSPKRLEVGKPDLNNSLDYSTYKNERWKTENTLTFDRTFDKHTVGALLATTADHYHARGFQITGKTFDDESDYLQFINYAGTISASDVNYAATDANVAVVARGSYSYDDRYFVTASWRRDYAGRLPQGNNYGDFPAVTGAWKISSEPFFSKNGPVDLLKIRASWGRIGNLGSVSMNYKSPSLSSSFWAEQAIYGVENGSFYNNFMYLGKALNGALTWETSQQWDLGLDAEMFAGRLSVGLDYYDKKTYNLIQEQSMGWPQTIGVDPMLVNQGVIRNRGFEALVSWNDKLGKDWSYFMSANFAYNKNRVESTGIYDDEGNAGVWVGSGGYRTLPYIYQTAVGQPLNSFYMIKTDGIFQTDAEAAAYVSKDGSRIQPQAVAGDLKFVDYNGDGKITDDDRQYLGSSMPKATFSFTGGMTWKNLSCSFMLQGVAGAKAAYMAKYSLLSDVEGEFNRSRDILNAWSPSNTSSNIPRLSKNDPNGNFTTPSDWYLEDASYIRLKNVTISYDLTDALRRCAHFDARGSRMSVYFSGENLLTFTKYSGMDPEVGGYDALRYPVSRVLSFGVKLTY